MNTISGSKKIIKFPWPIKRKRRFSRFICPLTIASHLLFGGGENNGRGTRAIAMGNSFVAIADNAWAVNYNPAGLAALSRLEISMFLVPQQFGLSELRTTALGLIVPFQIGTVGVSIEHFGFDLYAETALRVGYGFAIDRGTSAGLTANVFRISIEKYGVTQQSSFDFGVVSKLYGMVKAGFVFRNITAATIGLQKEKLPQVLLIGVSYPPVKGLLVTTEIEKDVRFPAELKAGVEQIVFGILAFRVGIATNPDRFSAGLAARSSVFEFSYAGYSHSELGWTHQIEVAIRLGE